MTIKESVLPVWTNVQSHWIEKFVLVVTQIVGFRGVLMAELDV